MWLMWAVLSRNHSFTIIAQNCRFVKVLGVFLALFEPKTAGTLWVPAFSCKAKKWPLYDKKDDERDQEPVEEVFG